MDFNEIQQSWQAQPVNIPEDIAITRKRISTQWQQQQHKVLLSNIAATVGFIGTYMMAGWVYFTFQRGHSIYFTGSIVFVAALMTVYLWVIWRALGFEKNDTTLSSKNYIEESIKKLQWKRTTITTFKWIYTVLLWIAMMFYCSDRAQTNNPISLVVPAAVTVYLFGMRYRLRYTTEKKQLVEIDGLITDMKDLKDKMDQ